MTAIGRLFGRSPFAPLQTHMEKVAACVDKITAIFEAFNNENHEEVAKLAKTIAKLEHVADLTKNDIRNRLPKNLFMPIDRNNLLAILTLQDSIADQAEDIAVLLTLRKIDVLPDLKDDFQQFLTKNIEAFNKAHRVIQELHELLESSFGGIEAEKVRNMVEEVAICEHEVDLLQRQLLKKLFTHDELPTPVFNLWQLIFAKVGNLSNLAEKLSNRVQMTLETS